MKAITLPSGENAGRRSFGPAVIARALVAPFEVSTIQILPAFALPAGPRRKATRWPFGCQLGSSSVSPEAAIFFAPLPLAALIV